MEKGVLVRYIEEMISKGYSRDEIRQSMSNAGFKRSEINLFLEENIKKEGVEMEVLNYIQDNLEKGFRKEEISYALLLSGHDKEDINNYFRILRM